MDVTQRYPPFFAIIKPIVNRFNGRIPLKTLSYHKINAMPGQICGLFTFIPSVSHGKFAILLYIQLRYLLNMSGLVAGIGIPAT